MRIRVLGAIEVRRGEEWHRISAGKWRALLGALVVRPGQGLSADALAARLWGDDPAEWPSGAINQVHGYVLRVRRTLGDDGAAVLRRGSSGYELCLDSGDTDLDVFEELAARGLEQVREGEPAAAAETLRRALDLWRGDAFWDVPESVDVEAEAHRLEERRLTVLEARIEADLASGLGAELTAELAGLVDEFPFRERFWMHYMLALHRGGRQAEALEAYQRAFGVLAGELGIEPGEPLRDLHRQILRDAPSLRRGGPATRPVPRQLPPGVPDLDGRDKLVGELDAQVGESGGGSIVVLTGQGGVGKTALAVHWGHRVAARFPDGQIFVDLRGFSTSAPVGACDVLGRVLRTLGLDAGQVPGELDEATALYRSMLADRRVLVVLDNASGPDQVRPLLAAGDGCLTLVTSRDQMRDLVVREGARQVCLDTLTPNAGLDLLARRIGHDRVAAERSDALEIVRYCDGLPLALCISASNIAGCPSMSLSTYRRMLCESGLDALQVETGTDTPGSSVRAAFDLSYRALPTDAAELFRLLSLIPGSDIALPAVDALLGSQPGTGRLLLRTLGSRHLLAHSDADRVSQHDLVRSYAAEQCARVDPPETRRHAIERLHAWYAGTSIEAIALVAPAAARSPSALAITTSGRGFPDRSDALDWLETELETLEAVIRADGGALACGLADALRGFFAIRQYADRWLTIAELGLNAAEQHGDGTMRAAAALNLAQAHRCAGRYRAARDLADRALQIARDEAWSRGEVAALNELGTILLEQGLLSRAAVVLERGLRIASQHHPDVQRHLLNNLGHLHRQAGDLHRSIACFRGALRMEGAGASRHLSSVSHAALAARLRELGQFDKVGEHLDVAIEMQRELGYDSELCASLGTLALLHGDLGQIETANSVLDELKRLVIRLQDRRIDSYLHAVTAELAIRAGKFVDAFEHARTAESYASHGQHRWERVRALIILADAQLRTDGVGGRATARRALRLAREHGFGYEERLARSLLARHQTMRDDRTA